MRTDSLTFCPSASGAIGYAESMTTAARHIPSSPRRQTSGSSECGSVTSGCASLPSSASLSNSPTSTHFTETLNEDSLDEDDIEYFAQFECPSETDDEADDLFVEHHLSRQQLDFAHRLEENGYQRSKRSNKKMNARRQIKTKHAKSIKTKSHNKQLYIHHRLAKLIVLDGPSYHCISSPPPVPLFSLEALRSIVYQYRHSSAAYRNSTWTHIRASKRSPQHDTDESQVTRQFREYAINEYNFPDEPSFDDDMINFLLDMQNRDVSPEDYEMLLRLDEGVQRKTLSTNVLDTLPSVRVDATHVDDLCSICMDNYVLEQELKLLPCQHLFHSHCIETYLKEFSNQCPLDNLPLL